MDSSLLVRGTRLVHRRVRRVVRDYKQIVFVGKWVLRTRRGGADGPHAGCYGSCPRDVHAGAKIIPTRWPLVRNEPNQGATSVNRPSRYRPRTCSFCLRRGSVAASVSRVPSSCRGLGPDAGARVWLR